MLDRDCIDTIAAEWNEGRREVVLYLMGSDPDKNPRYEYAGIHVELSFQDGHWVGRVARGNGTTYDLYVCTAADPVDAALEAYDHWQ
jgi:hypothetical protein